MVAFILYRLTFPNGKIYIGQTVRSMKTRLAQHRTAANRGSSLAVHCAWRKHGEPSVCIIDEYGSQEALHAAEIAAIQSEGSLSPNGYNVGLGGETAPSKSPEVRAKIGAKSKGRIPNTTEERSEIARKCWQSEEYRENQREAQRARWCDPSKRAEQSEKIKAAWGRRKAAGYTVSEATKAKLSSRPVSAETRAKMSAAAKARKRTPVSEETRRKLSERAKEAWQNPDVTTRRVAAIKATVERKTQEAKQ